MKTFKEQYLAGEIEFEIVPGAFNLLVPAVTEK